MIGNLVPRIRNAFSSLTNTGRERATLIIILAIVFVLVLSTFAYLVLRRR